MTSREEIAAALTAAGMAGTVTKTGPIVAGDAWPVWRGTTWPNATPGGVRLGRWFVFVALPGGGPDVSALAADPLVETIGDALIAAGLQITLCEPFSWPVEPGLAAVSGLRYSVND